jgi:hypothetical protein
MLRLGVEDLPTQEEALVVISLEEEDRATKHEVLLNIMSGSGHNSYEILAIV